MSQITVSRFTEAASLDWNDALAVCRMYTRGNVEKGGELTRHSGRSCQCARPFCP